MREQITDGLDTCVDGGAMEARLNPEGTLDWRWSGDGVEASATLTRVR